MGAVLTICPKCQRQVPIGSMRGFLWWRSCHCCRDAIAALALHEHEHGFTHEDVKLLDEIKDENYGCDPLLLNERKEALLVSIRNRIAALLPPKP